MTLNASLLPAAMMLASAVIHAGIGLWLKKSGDKIAFRAVLAVTTAAIILPFAFFVPLPAAQAWPFLLGGALIHFIYQLSQISAFERGDMGLVYPVMRGIAPALAAGFAYIYLKETLSPLELSGLLIAAFALVAFGWPARNRPERWGSAMIFAIICGIMIALYSVIDGAGMRMARDGQGQIWSYLVWFFLLDWILLIPTAIFMRRKSLRAAIVGAGRSGVIAGVASLFSYGLALIAFSMAPIGPMSAMRETSVVFGAVFAAVILKEDFGRRRIMLAVILSAGLIAMQFG